MAQPTLTRPLDSERVFFALWPDDALRSALYALAQAWRMRCGGRVTRRENLHLTLAFVGNVEAEQVALLRDIAARQVVRPFELALDAGAYFKRNRIASAQPSATPAALAEVVAALAWSLRSSGVAFDARPYVPHVTLLRDAGRAPVRAIEPPLAWRAEALYLVRSQRGAAGVSYEPIAASQQL